MSDTNLASLVEKMSNHRVVCVGDVMLDRYIYGQVERISPEAPIPVLHIQRETATLGGAGNVVRNIVSLGGQIDLIGVIGQDAAGYELAKTLASLPQVTSNLLTDNSRPTTLKIRYVADGQQMLRADQEVNQAISADMEKQIMMRVRAALDGCKILILSDYAKGVLTTQVVRQIIDAANAANVMTLIDPKGRDFSRYNGASIITPNRKELSEVVGFPIRTVQDAEKASRQLIEAHQLQGVLAKLGSDGVCLIMKGEPPQHFRASAREVFDVSGAGDTVVATMALALAGGLTPVEGAALANIAGSIVVGKIGTATITQDELVRELRHDQTRVSEEKLVGLAEAAEQAERWRKQGLRVGFTNGCFDLLHPGHISLIRQARAACDKLILGLNSDSSVKRLKGETRPVQNEIARATVLSSLSDIDRLVIFSEETPLNLIKAIRPNVLVKGADYTVATVVGADLVQGWGGEVVLAKLVEGQSTTSTIAKLNTKKTGDAA